MGSSFSRRKFVERLGLATGGIFALPWLAKANATTENEQQQIEQTDMHPIIQAFPLGFQWETQDPFLFCVHHEDYFPKGNAAMGPDPENFKGRHMGDDFIIKDGFRMYHGKTVPGFPGHPHRGFETVTVVRKGLVDHADSLGAAGRYGNGDVQWMTAGKGVQHSEMFPLLSETEENPMELFQVWLNLPKRNKMVDPHFKMLWREDIPNIETKKEKGGTARVELISGLWSDKKGVTPPPNSWAFENANEVLIANIKMEPNSTITLPKASKGVNRTVYFYEGEQLVVSGKTVNKYTGMKMLTEVETILETGTSEASIFILQGKPIGEQVMQYGPFVMNTKEEIQQAFDDYHRTQFGGWPWPKYDQVHDRSKLRFAKHADGKLEEKQEV